MNVFIEKTVSFYIPLVKGQRCAWHSRGILVSMKKGIFLAVSFLVLFGAVYIGGSMLVRAARASVAQSRGQAYIAKLYAEYAIVGENCQGEDLDNDSYVSCDFRIKNGLSEERVINLQCPTVWKSFLGDTCKESRLALPQQ